MKQNRAFTILEILVVVGIITILATIGLSTYSSIQKKSRDARRISDIEILRAAVEQFRSNNNDYPPDSSTQFLPYPSGGGNAGLCDPSPGGCTSGIYLGKIPTDPTATQRYWYQRISASDYTLCARISPPGPSSVGNCAASGPSLTCNYCMGPYGVK